MTYHWIALAVTCTAMIFTAAWSLRGYMARIEIKLDTLSARFEDHIASRRD